MLLMSVTNSSEGVYVSPSMSFEYNGLFPSEPYEDIAMKLAKPEERKDVSHIIDLMLSSREGMLTAATHPLARRASHLLYTAFRRSVLEANGC